MAIKYGSRLDVRIEDDTQRLLEERAVLEEREIPDVVRRILRAALIPVTVAEDIHGLLTTTFGEGADDEAEDALWVESGVLPKLLARAEQEPRSDDWEQELAEL